MRQQQKQIQYIQVTLSNGISAEFRCFLDLSYVSAIWETAHDGITEVRIDGFLLMVKEAYDDLLSKWVDYLLSKIDGRSP